MNTKYLTLGLLVVLVIVLAVSVHGLSNQGYGTWLKSYPAWANATGTMSTPAAGGNITAYNVVANTTTDKWNGFYGNVSGSVILANDTNIFYYWTYSAGGEVCMSEAAVVPALTTATAKAIDVAWSFGSSTDNATNTFTGSGCKGLTAVDGDDISASVNATHKSGKFTCAADDGGAAESNHWFCTVISSGTCWDGSTCTYELMVPTSVGAVETYYVYAELS